MVYKEMLSNIINEMTERKRLLEYELGKSPDGALNIHNQNGRHYYSVRLPKGGNRKKVHKESITGNKPLINALFRKKYMERAIRLIDDDIKILTAVLGRYKEVDEQSVMKEYLENYPELAEGLYQNGINDKEWSEDYLPQKGFYEEGLRSTDASGVGMRSKGEIIIASRLDLYKIPYRYEAEIKHPDIDRIPDFTIRRPRDGKIIYWEHLGLKEINYLQRNELKFVEYENVDIVPWDNLIVTYDNAKGGIDVKLIDALIQGWLL